MEKAHIVIDHNVSVSLQCATPFAQLSEEHCTIVCISPVCHIQLRMRQQQQSLAHVRKRKRAFTKSKNPPMTPFRKIEKGIKKKASLPMQTEKNATNFVETRPCVIFSGFAHDVEAQPIAPKFNDDITMMVVDGHCVGKKHHFCTTPKKQEDEESWKLTRRLHI